MDVWISHLKSWSDTDPWSRSTRPGHHHHPMQPPWSRNLPRSHSTQTLTPWEAVGVCHPGQLSRSCHAAVTSCHGFTWLCLCGQSVTQLCWLQPHSSLQAWPAGRPSLSDLDCICGIHCRDICRTLGLKHDLTSPLNLRVLEKSYFGQARRTGEPISSNSTQLKSCGVVWFVYQVYLVIEKLV